MELEQTSLGPPPESRVDTVGRLSGSHASAGATRDPIGPRRPAPFPVAELLIGLAVGVAAYGVAASDEIVALLGLATTALTAMSVVLATRASKQRLARRCEVLARARHQLEVENAELERRNADLEEQRAAIVNGFDWVDEQTAGRLRSLLDAAGLELADLADMVLDDLDEGA
jgi:hypothetical protein